MEDLIIAVVVLVVLFVGFGLSQRRGKRISGCSGCAVSCSDHSECAKKAEASQH